MPGRNSFDRTARGGPEKASPVGAVDRRPSSMPKPSYEDVLNMTLKIPKQVRQRKHLPSDFTLHDFDQAISTLKRLMTKPSARFADSTHSIHDLENVTDFIRAVVIKVRSANSNA
jgi:hypothetical protein